VTAHAKLYEDLHVATLSGGTADYVKVELKRITDALGNKHVGSVTQKDVQAIIDKAMARGPAARNTTWKVCRAFFAWVAARGDIPESPVAKIARPSKDRIRKRALDDAEIKVVWEAAEAAGGASGALVKLLLLSGCRRDEMCYLPHADIKADKIVFSASRTKNDEPHTVPITPMIRRVLNTLPKAGKIALTGADKGLGGHSQARDAIKTPGIDHWTYHDLRRSFASGLARLGVPIQVTELCLNHKSGVGGDPLVQIYQQHDYAKEVVAAFEKWSEHVESLVTEKERAAA
jgi:integrase